MGDKRMVRLAWALCGLTACLGVGLSGASLLSQAGSKNAFLLASDAFYLLAMPVVFAIVGALIIDIAALHLQGALL
jgi:hypothetical protein